MISRTGDTWLRRYDETPVGRPRLICFPHAGGSASYFRPFSSLLLPAVEMVAVQYPGRQDRYREPCIDSIAALADAIVAVLPEWLDRPVAFFGHSMGAAVAYEVALRMRRTMPEHPIRLFASGRRAPSTVRDGEHIHLRDDPGLVAELRRLNGTDARLLTDPDVLDMILPMTRSDYRAIETYDGTTAAPVNCPINVLVGDCDPTTTLAEAQAWARHTTGHCSVEVFRGGHFYLDSSRAQVAATVIRTLNGNRHQMS